MSEFVSERTLPGEQFARLTELRVADPERALRAARQRARRAAFTRDGRLNLIAADHPGRGVIGALGDPMRMADRRDFLARILRVLPVTDGVMATMDVLEDLLILDDLRVEAGEQSLLDDRLLIASMNRAGIAGSCWELDDPMTGPGADAIDEWGLDGGKVLLRLNLDNRDSLRTVEAVAEAVTRLSRKRLPVFLEPLPVASRDGAWKVEKEPEAMARAVSIAQALGESSRYTWLKLPYVEPFDKVAAAGSLPIVILGGAATGNSAALIEQIEAALRVSQSVRGTMVGRNVLYAGDEDPRAVAERVSSLVHAEES